MDGVGVVRSVAAEGAGRRVGLDVPGALARFVAEKGSLAVDGVSLTVAACAGASCEVALIPHTLEVTVAGEYEPGRQVIDEWRVSSRTASSDKSGSPAGPRTVRRAGSWRLAVSP